MTMDEFAEEQVAGERAAVSSAYDSFEPSDEAIERMWANISAQVEASSEVPKAAVTEAQQEVPRIKAVRPRWKRVLPVAACLVAGAIAVGVAGSALFSTPNVAPVPVQGKSGTTEAATAVADGYMAEEAGMYAESYIDDPTPFDLPEGFNTEEYSYIDENGFVSTRLRPLSTVSSDVDTASYANLRRLVRQGSGIGDIPEGAVRIEEMLNYFSYDYAVPSGNDLVAQTVQVGACPWNPDTQLLVMGFATAPESALANKGSNLVFLIDVSGSMNGEDRLGLLQDSFATLLANLDENDTVSIVTYSGEEKVVLDGASGADKERILRAIYRLKAHGYTNGEAGLRMAYDVAQSHFIDGGVNRIILASDGDLNVGISSESDLHEFVEEKRETGVYLSVLGFGAGNYKDNKMETLADHGNGSYHYIDCLEEAERVFEKNLTANLVPLADDVKIRIEFNPALVKGYRLIGYENRALADEDFRNDAADAGDIGPNAQFTVAYEIVPIDSSFAVYEPELHYGQAAQEGAHGAGAYGNELLTCAVRYKRAGTDVVSEQSFTVDTDDIAANPSEDWNFAAAVIEVGMSLRDSSYKGSASLENARDLLAGMRLDDERVGFLELVETLERNSNMKG